MALIRWLRIGWLAFRLGLALIWALPSLISASRKLRKRDRLIAAHLAANRIMAEHLAAKAAVEDPQRPEV